MRAFAFVLMAAGLAVSPRAVRADAVRPEPRNCPDGSQGATGHAGPYCAPIPCTSDAECTAVRAGWVCREVPLCVNQVTYTDWSGQRYTRDEVVGPCAADGSCTPPATCDTSKKCAPPIASGSGPTGSSGSSGAQSGAGGTGGAGGSAGTGGQDTAVEGCSCAVPASRAATGFAAVLALAIAAVARRASRRASPAARAGRRRG